MRRWLTRRKRALLDVAPISDAPPSDRAMRSALETARTIPEAAASLTAQQEFDQALARLVRKIEIPREAREWFVNGALMEGAKRSWKKTARHPAILATALAMLVIAGLGIYFLVQRLHEFPGSATAQKLLVVARTTPKSEFEPLRTDAINLGDYFFMKARLEHFDVPIQFADFRATGARIFDDEDGNRIAQVALAESGLQFFFFHAEPGSPRHAPSARPFWRYVDAEGWAGAVEARDGVYFMVAMRGSEADLRSYLAKVER